MSIGAIERIENLQLSGIDRVQQRISDIESKFGFGGISGADFQSVLAKAMRKVNADVKVVPVETINKPEKVSKTNKTDKVNDIDNVDKSNKNVETFNDVNDKTSVNKKSKIKNNPIEKVEPEEVEVPTRDTKRERVTSTEEMIESAAEKYNVDSNLVKAVAIAESNMNQNDISDAGAIGVMQLMPSTAAALGVDPYDEQQNIEGGAKYLRQMLDTFNGNVKKAIAAYNAGPNAVKKYGGIPPYSETQNYVGRVMDLYR